MNFSNNINFDLPDHIAELCFEISVQYVECKAKCWRKFE